MSDDLPPEAVRMARAVVFDLGEDWLRRDALDRIEGAYLGLFKGGRRDAVAAELRKVADFVEHTDPLDHLRASLRRIEQDAQTRTEAA